MVVEITAAVYSAVALLVKADDLGVKLSQTGRFSATRSLGKLIVRAMPTVMVVISTVGTAAMLWVGGSIIVHGLHDLGVHAPYDLVKHLAGVVSEGVGVAKGLVKWITTATTDGVIGLVLGGMLIPVVKFVLMPVVGLFRREG